MSLIDIYDKKGKHIGVADRKEVHAKGLWHKTIHCWIVTNRDSIIFQQRAKNLKDNPGKLYTTASGHLEAGESMKNAFNREVREELGINIKIDECKLLFSEVFIADLIKTDGTEYHDRAFVNRYITKINLPLSDYDFQEEEISGLFEIKLSDLKDLMNDNKKLITADVLYKENGIKQVKKQIVAIKDFLVPDEHTFDEVVGRIVVKGLNFLKLLKT